MKEVSLRTWHRRVGIVLAMFIIVQALSGTFLDLTWFITPHDFINRIAVTDPSVLRYVQKNWESILEFAHAVHLGGLIPGAAYRILLTVVLLFLSVTGTMIFWEERKRMSPKHPVAHTKEDQ
jgi:hypothetical protein